MKLILMVILVLLVILIAVFAIMIYKKTEYFNNNVIELWENKGYNSSNQNKLQNECTSCFFDKKIPQLMRVQKSPNYNNQEIKIISDFIENQNYKRLNQQKYLPNIKEYKYLKNCKFTTQGLVISNNTNYIIYSCGREGGDYNDKNIKNKANLKVIDSGIYLCGKWAQEYWHFIYEYMASCLNIDDYKKYKIIVPNKSKIIMEWLDLIGVSKDNIVSGDGFAKELIIPRPQNCGNPSNDILDVLSKKIVSNLNINYKNRNNIILIKRTKNRSLINHNELEQYFKQYCLSYNYNLVVHDDSNLPSIKEQLIYFSKALMVIGPHGAGLSNILVCKKDTKIIEIFMNNNINLCYCDLSIRLGLKYVGLVATDNRVSLDKLDTHVV